MQNQQNALAHAPVTADHIEEAALAELRNRLIGRTVGNDRRGDLAAKGAVHIDFSGINEKVEAAVPTIKNIIGLLGPVLPAQVPLVVNAVLHLYDVIDSTFLKPSPAPAAG